MFFNSTYFNNCILLLHILNNNKKHRLLKCIFLLNFIIYILL